MPPQASALSEIVEAHTEYLLRAAIGFGLSGSDAEDLVQDTFKTFLEIRDRFEGRSSVRTFLYGILYRKNLERSRKAARETAVDPVEGKFASRFDEKGMWQTPPRGPSEEALSSETEGLIADCMDGLSEQQRSAFFFKEIEKMPPEEICNVLGIKPTHLRVLLFRARNGLRECLERKWEKSA
jgi:RNA polymerase sigma-70 factor (ECF subfamily)